MCFGEALSQVVRMIRSGDFEDLVSRGREKDEDDVVDSEGS